MMKRAAATEAASASVLVAESLVVVVHCDVVMWYPCADCLGDGGSRLVLIFLLQRWPVMVGVRRKNLEVKRSQKRGPIRKMRNVTEDECEE